MGLAFVVAPHQAVAAGRPDDLQKEWQECRATIGRLDSTLVDLRKYGFGLASGLLTAGGVVGGIANIITKPAAGSTPYSVPNSVIVALVAVTMVLVTVLSVVDRYYSMVQWAAVTKARGLERDLSLGMTSEISRWVAYKLPTFAGLRSLWRWIALAQYASFVVVAAALGTTVMGAQAAPSLSRWSAADTMWLVGAISLGVMGLVFWAASREFKALAVDSALPAVARGVSIFTVRLRKELSVQPGTAEIEIGVNPSFPEDAKAIAVVMPTNDRDVSVVGCRILRPDFLRVTLTNSSDGERTIPRGDVQAFIYV